jgi:ribosome-associated translation inhibitor RaiA
VPLFEVSRPGEEPVTFPITVTSRWFPLTEAEETLVRRRAEALRGSSNRIMSCRVTVEMPHRRWRPGAKHHVRVDLRMPGERILVTRQAGESFTTAVHEAFAAARRQVADTGGRPARGG